MVTLVIQNGTHAKAREFARKTIESQRKEIAAFAQWLGSLSPPGRQGGEEMPGMQQ